MERVNRLAKSQHLNKNQACEVLARVAGCIRRRRNVAAATQYQHCATKVRSPEELANDNRKFIRKVYHEWVIGETELPKFDWQENQAPVLCGSAAKLRKLQVKAHAMARAWKVDASVVKPEHYMWLSGNMPQWLPLIVSIECVIKAERHLQGGLDTMDAREYAELETLNVLLRKCNRVINPAATDSMPHIRKAAQDRNVVNRRITELRLKKKPLDSHSQPTEESEE